MYLQFLLILSLSVDICSYAQESPTINSTELKQVEVEEIVADRKIEKRLSDILKAIGPYEEVQVKVISGVAILTGVVKEESEIEWALNLAKRIDGVVAVQSQLKSPAQDLTDLSSARKEWSGLQFSFMRHLPTIVMALSVLVFSFILFLLTSFGFRRAFSKKIPSPLLLNALSKMLSIPVLLLGVYLALKISGLAGLAFTVLGGTGILGVALGLSLKNSLEDYSSSILLSLKKPFLPSDWVKIGENEGIVQKVTSRSTLIIDFDGNHILIPNSIVYGSIITNITANPKMRQHFELGLHFEDSIESAQKIIISILKTNDIVLDDPSPWVRVEKLGDSYINLRVYFWLNVREVSPFKVSSHILLDVKNKLLAEGFRFPDPNREIVFTNSIHLERDKAPSIEQDLINKPKQAPLKEELLSEASELNQQALESNLPDQGESVI